MKQRPIKTTQDERDYALAKSKKLPNCPRPNDGSMAHTLLWALHQMARKDGIKLERSEKYPHK